MPDAEFVARSRKMLFAASSIGTMSFKRGFWEDVKFGAALIVAGAFMLFFALLYSQVSFVGGVRTASTQAEVFAEAQALQFDIELGEATYFADSAEEVAAVLQEIEGERNARGENN